jgi:hypothetical protein
MNLEFQLHSFWHAGTGRGDGPGADAIIHRSPSGLPFLPGRTVKGLLRDASKLGELLKLLPEGSAMLWFGTDIPRDEKASIKESDGSVELERARFNTEPGCLRAGSATLGSAWEQWAAAALKDRELLAMEFASTKIEDSGIALDKSLRSIEIAVPMTLKAEISALKSLPAGWEDQLEKVLPYIRSLGSHRNRGLGRVSVRRVK